MNTYAVFVSYYDELALIVVDAASEEEAVNSVREQVIEKARERASVFWWTPAEITEYAEKYRAYDYRAWRISVSGDAYRDVILPRRCPY